MGNQKYAAFEGARPYFQLVRRALGDLVDGDHFFDIVADNIVYEVLYEIAGWPRVINGRNLLDRVNAGKVVAPIAATEIPDIRACEGFALPVAATGVRLEDEVAVA